MWHERVDCLVVIIVVIVEIRGVIKEAHEATGIVRTSDHLAGKYAW